MTNLQTRLTSIRESFAKRAPDNARTIMQRVTQELIDAKRAEQALGAGDKAPAFRLPNATGELVSSDELLARGPLVVTFFRGHW